MGCVRRHPSSTLIYFYFKDLKKLIKTHESIRKNAELIDTIQQTALEMTELADSLQALVFKHASQVKQTIEDIRLIGHIAETQGTRQAEALSPSIVKTTENVKFVIRDLKTALIESDAAGLNKYLAQVREYRTEIRDLLGKTLSQ